MQIRLLKLLIEAEVAVAGGTTANFEHIAHIFGIVAFRGDRIGGTQLLHNSIHRVAPLGTDEIA
jgi:hypothetical protein